MSDQQSPQVQKKPRENIVDMAKYIDKSIRVKFGGGREVVGILKGQDMLLNLVLDEAKEYLRDPEDPSVLLDDMRDLGLVVCRGTAVVLVCPTDGMEEIANPFVDGEEQEQDSE